MSGALLAVLVLTILALAFFATCIVALAAMSLRETDVAKSVVEVLQTLGKSLASIFTVTAKNE